MGSSKEKLKFCFSNPKENTRRLSYLDLNIPDVDHSTKTPGLSRTCNFQPYFENRRIPHVWHSEVETATNAQLNTVVDLIINLSENLYKNDYEVQAILKKMKSVNPSEAMDSIISKMEVIIANQSFVKDQILQLQSRVEKTLNKADKFPSKKDIKSFTEEIKAMVATPQILEEKVLKIVLEQRVIAEQERQRDADDLKKILRGIRDVKVAVRGYESDLDIGE